MEVVPETTEVQNLQELKKTYACPHCDKVFIREGWLEPHIRTQHRKVKNRTGQFDIFHHSGRTRSQLPYSQVGFQICKYVDVTMYFLRH